MMSQQKGVLCFDTGGSDVSRVMQMFRRCYPDWVIVLVAPVDRDESARSPAGTPAPRQVPQTVVFSYEPQEPVEGLIAALEEEVRRAGVDVVGILPTVHWERPFDELGVARVAERLGVRWVAPEVVELTQDKARLYQRLVGGRGLRRLGLRVARQLECTAADDADATDEILRAIARLGHGPGPRPQDVRGAVAWGLRRVRGVIVRPGRVVIKPTIRGVCSLGVITVDAGWSKTRQREAISEHLRLRAELGSPSTVVERRIEGPRVREIGYHATTDRGVSRFVTTGKVMNRWNRQIANFVDPGDRGLRVTEATIQEVMQGVLDTLGVIGDVNADLLLARRSLPARLAAAIVGAFGRIVGSSSLSGPRPRVYLVDLQCRPGGPGTLGTLDQLFDATYGVPYGESLIRWRVDGSPPPVWGAPVAAGIAGDACVEPGIVVANATRDTVRAARETPGVLFLDPGNMLHARFLAPMTNFHQQTGAQRRVNIVVTGRDMHSAVATRDRALAALGVVTLLEDHHRLTGIDYHGQWVTLPLPRQAPAALEATLDEHPDLITTVLQQPTDATRLQAVKSVSYAFPDLDRRLIHVLVHPRSARAHQTATTPLHAPHHSSHPAPADASRHPRADLRRAQEVEARPARRQIGRRVRRTPRFMGCRATSFLARDGRRHRLALRSAACASAPPPYEQGTVRAARNAKGVAAFTGRQESMVTREPSQERMIASTMAMIRIRPTGATGAVARVFEYAAGQLAASGIESRVEPVDEGRVLVAEVGPPDAAVTVWWAAHADVVPGSDDQFEPRREGERLVGRGSLDMLGAFAVQIEVLPHVLAAGRGLVKVVLVVVDKEEGPPPHPFRGYVARARELGQVPDFVIIGEQTQLQVAPATKGSAYVVVTVRGIGGHSSTPWLLSNPIGWGMALAQRLERLPFTRERSEHYPQGPSVALTAFHAGGETPASYTTIPDEARFVLGVRVLPSQSTRAVLAQIEQELRVVEGELRAEQASRGLVLPGGLSAISVQMTVSREPYSASADNHFVSMLCEAVRPYHPDGAPLLRYQHGAGDVAYLGEIPAVEFGCRGQNPHGRYEYLDTTSLEPYGQTLLAHVQLLANHAQWPRGAGARLPQARRDGRQPRFAPARRREQRAGHASRQQTERTSFSAYRS